MTLVSGNLVGPLSRFQALVGGLMSFFWQLLAASGSGARLRHSLERGGVVFPTAWENEMSPFVEEVVLSIAPTY